VLLRDNVSHLLMFDLFPPMPSPYNANCALAVRIMRRFLVVRCKTCHADLIFREISGSPHRPIIRGTGLATCPGCHREHEYFDEDVRVIEASEES